MDYALAILMFAAGILVRQPAVAIGLAFLIGDLATNRNWKISLARSLPVFIGGIFLVVIFPAAISLISELRPEYFLRSAQMKQIIIQILSLQLGALLPAIRTTFFGMLYFGLLAAPIMMPIAYWRWKTRFYDRWAIIIAGMVAAGFECQRYRKRPDDSRYR